MTIRPKQSELSATLKQGEEFEVIYDAIVQAHPSFEGFQSKRIPGSQLIMKDFRSPDGAMASSVFYPSDRKMSVVISNAAGDESNLSTVISERLYDNLISSQCCSLVEFKRSGVDAR